VILYEKCIAKVVFGLNERNTKMGFVEIYTGNMLSKSNSFYQLPVAHHIPNSI
jgi:hypothetical protein